MDNNTLAIYMHELRNLLFNTQGSFNLFNGAMQQKQVPGILYGGQLVIQPVSQMSALLWPPRARARSRGESLRKVLQLPEKHVLNDRRLSEVADRGDEKMDDWIASTKGQRIMIDFVGDVQETMNQLGGELTVEGIYRAYDPANQIFYYRGVGYNLKAIADALTDVGGRINTVYLQMFPEQAKAEAEQRQKLMEAQQQAQAANQAAPTAAAADAGDVIDVAGGISAVADAAPELTQVPPKPAAEADEAAPEKPKRKRTTKKKSDDGAEG